MLKSFFPFNLRSVRSLFYLQSLTNPIDQLCILFLIKINLIGVHSKCSAPFGAVAVLRHQMKMQVVPGVTIRALIDLLGVKYLMQRLSHTVDLGKIGVSLFV